MFGSHFYHATVRKSVAVFGTLFNNITVARKKGDGSLINQVKVPLAYGPKQKFLSRLDTETGQDASIAIKLPRLSFEITSIEQDTNKKLQKRVSIDEPIATTVVTGSTTTRTQVTDLSDGTFNYALDSGVKRVTASPAFGSANDTASNPSWIFSSTPYIARLTSTSDSEGVLTSTLTITFVSNMTFNGNGDGTNLAEADRSSFYGQSMHPSENDNLSATNTVLSFGGVDLKVSDATVTAKGAFLFQPNSVEYVWVLTQTQQDTIYDNGISSAGSGSGPVVMSWDTIVTTATTATSTRKSIKQQSPYNINMQLNIMAKNQDDGLQILEQIIPYFQPEYTVAIKPIDDMTSFKQDVPIILNSVSFDDQYEGDYNSRRVLIYTLDFTMKMTFYGPLTEPKIIRQVLIDFTEERKFGAAITLPSALSYPTFFVPGATIYQGTDRNRTWSGTIDSLEPTIIRLVENNTTGYTAGAPVFVNNNGEIQRFDAVGNTIALSADLNTLSSIDIKVGDTDTESEFTVTTTIDNTDFS